MAYVAPIKMASQNSTVISMTIIEDDVVLESTYCKWCMWMLSISMKLPKCMYTVALNSIIKCQPPGWVMSATGEGIVVLLCRALSVEQLGMGK